MKRVGLIITNLAGSGAEKIVIQMARMFQKNHMDTHIFLLENIISYDDIEGLSMHVLSEKRDIYKLLKTYGDYLLSIKLRRKIKEIVSDGVNFDLFLSNAPASDRIMHIANLPHTAYVIHSSYALEIEEFRKRGKVRRADKKEKLYKRIYKDKILITVSKSAQQDFSRLMHHYQSIQTIYNPFDFEAIRKCAKINSSIQHENYIVSASAFRYVKRHDILLEAYSRLHNPPPLKLLCNKHPELEKMIYSLGLQEKVEILGFQTNPYPYIQHARLLVLSSEREGLPTVLIEALILNTPVVSTDCISGPREILTGELSHFLAKVNDSTDLAEKMNKALADYPEITYDMITKFDESVVFEQYFRLTKE